MAEVYSAVTDKVAHGVADLLGAHRPKYSAWGFELLKKDPVLEFFRARGFKVVEYDLDPYPLRLAAIIAVRMGLMIISEFRQKRQRGRKHRSWWMARRRERAN